MLHIDACAEHTGLGLDDERVQLANHGTALGVGLRGFKSRTHHRSSLTRTCCRSSVVSLVVPQGGLAE